MGSSGVGLSLNVHRPSTLSDPDGFPETLAPQASVSDPVSRQTAEHLADRLRHTIAAFSYAWFSSAGQGFRLKSRIEIQIPTYIDRRLALRRTLSTIVIFNPATASPLRIASQKSRTLN